MKIYMNSYISRTGDGHTGYSYHSSKKDAKRAKAIRAYDDDCETTLINVKRSKYGILLALNTYAVHADNG